MSASLATHRAATCSRRGGAGTAAATIFHFFGNKALRAGLDALDADEDADVRDFAAAARAAIDA
jgi:hypothetical protein